MRESVFLNRSAAADRSKIEFGVSRDISLEWVQPNLRFSFFYGCLAVDSPIHSRDRQGAAC
jgi:hypothetical protein